MTIQNYVFIIGSADDFTSVEHLLMAYGDGTINHYNASVFEYEAPAEDVGKMTARDIRVLIGRGLAFENGWCMDDTVSYLMVV